MISIFFFRFLNALIGLARDSSDGYLLANQITDCVESFLPGFLSHALPLCYKENARAQNSFFPVENFLISLSLARDLDFDRLWRIRSSDPTLDDLREERLQVYNDTQNPHPTRIFNLASSTWFQNLLQERISVDRYHCTYIGSYNFAEVYLESYFQIFIKKYF